MMASPSHPAQRGAALFALLAFSLFGVVAYLSLAAAQRPVPPQSSESRLQSTLAHAREALIARAAGDDNRPGSLPCPDLLTDTAALANHPGDGKADMLTRNQCPSHIGWLPWVTLGIPRPQDDSHGTLWYVLAPGLRDDDSAMPINSDKPTGLTVDGQENIAALLIAARAPLSGQQRPSHNPADYLEGLLQGSTTVDYQQDTRPGNDRILPISRAELMAMVEQRVVHSVRHCLSSHARQIGRYPWPAPLAASASQGLSGALFGRLPLTQPSDGIARELEKAGMDLASQRAALTNAPEAQEKIVAVETLAEFSQRAKNLFASLKLAGEELNTLGKQATNALNKLQVSITNAAENDRISRSEGTSIMNQHALAITAVNSLTDALLRYGLDALLWQAIQQRDASGEPRPARLALLEAIKQQQLAAQQFALLDNANPRPLQQALVTPALVIGQRASETAYLSYLVSSHAEAVAVLASANITLAEQTHQAIKGKNRAKDAITAWQAKPTTSNRNKMDSALAELEQATSALNTGLQSQTAISTSGEATAWPMSWASVHCDFLQKGPGWWHDNAWADLIFFQINASGSITQGDLRLAGRENLPLVVLSAGPQRPGQQRPGSTIEHYLEGLNADPSRNGEARNPVTQFDQPDHSDVRNDRIAY
jgi:hypothetical protein